MRRGAPFSACRQLLGPPFRSNCAAASITGTPVHPRCTSYAGEITSRRGGICKCDSELTRTASISALISEMMPTSGNGSSKKSITGPPLIPPGRPTMYRPRRHRQESASVGQTVEELNSPTRGRTSTGEPASGNPIRSARRPQAPSIASSAGLASTARFRVPAR
jgi:hypothetical protein